MTLVPLMVFGCRNKEEEEQEELGLEFRWRRNWMEIEEFHKKSVPFKPHLYKKKGKTHLSSISPCFGYRYAYKKMCVDIWMDEQPLKFKFSDRFEVGEKR